MWDSGGRFIRDEGPHFDCLMLVLVLVLVLENGGRIDYEDEDEEEHETPLAAPSCTYRATDAQSAFLLCGPQRAGNEWRGERGPSGRFL